MEVQKILLIVVAVQSQLIYNLILNKNSSTKNIINMSNDPKKMIYKSIALKSDSLTESDGYFVFKGYASTFGNTDLGNDVVVKGAFSESIKKQLPVILYQHNSSFPIGITKSAVEDELGLLIEAWMPKDNTDCANVVSLMKCGAINSMSIGYFVDNSDYNKETGITYLQKINLMEISLVTFPMNPMAKITDVKSISNFNCMKDIENFLRNPFPLSKEIRKVFISKIKSFSSLRDVDTNKNSKEEEIEGRDVSDVSDQSGQLLEMANGKLNQLIKTLTGESHARTNNRFERYQ